MADLNVGDPAPDFTAQNQKGETIKLADLRGKRVVLYFYPKDDTPGCTKEACNFRDNIATLSDQDTVVLGVSPDDAESHQKFIDKFSLPFDLLVDTDKTIIEAYGAWGEKNNYGKKYMGLIRCTYVIGTDGNIEKIYKKVKTATHAEDILSDFS